MTNGEEQESLSPTVSQVIENFVDAMRNDSEIENSAVDRLEELLLKKSIPKSDEISIVLFDAELDDDK